MTSAIFQAAEIRAMLGCTDVPLLRRMFYLAMFGFGLRRGEAENLSVGQFDGLLLKMDDGRTIPISENVRDLMLRWYNGLSANDRLSSSWYMFDGMRSASTARFRRDLAVAGIDDPKRYTFYSLRITRIVCWFREGERLPYVASWSGMSPRGLTFFLQLADGAGTMEPFSFKDVVSELRE